MKISFATKSIAATAIFTWAETGFAHEGHGMTATHWHGTDTWGFVAVTALAVLALWWSGNGQ